MNLLLGNTETGLSPFKEPFKKECIKSIRLEYEKFFLEPNWGWKAIVRFKNGDTSGSQDFKVPDSTEYNSFEVITKKIQDFISSL